MRPNAVDPLVAETAELLADRRLVVRALRGSDGPSGAAGSANRADVGNAAELSDELAAIDARLAAVLGEPGAADTLATASAERAGVLRAVVAARRVEAARRSALAEAASVSGRAVADARELTRGESARVFALRTRAADALDPATGDGSPGASGSPGLPGASADAEAFGPIRDWSASITSGDRRDQALRALGALRLREARTQLNDGLLMTGQMRGIIDEAVPGLLRGDPVLLIGETGGAKTALAEHLSRAGLAREPELVSGYGDITTAQLIGSHELRAEGGATISVFVPGPLHRAMTEGRPVILDEVNAMPPEFLKRLNRILQLRPGDRLGVQEDSGREILIAPGFAILATANEQTPHRYRGLDRLSAELVNRFGANAYRVHYPDTGLAYDEFPRENALLAAASVVDAHGALPGGISPGDIAAVARAAFISQQVFAGEHGEGFAEYVSTERDIDGRPGLEESVLAPRTLVAILRKVAGSAGSITLDRALTRFVEGVMHAEDRRVLALILTGQGFRIG